MDEPLKINTDVSSVSEGQRSQLPELPDDGVCQDDLEDLGEELGSGASGKVRKCRYLKDGTFFAVKVVALWEAGYAMECDADKQTMKTINAEVNALRQHNCKYLINFYGAYYDAGTANFILEYMDIGSLQNILESNEKNGTTIPKSIIAHITSDALKGLQYIHHTLKMIHRDFKPGNLLLNKRGDVKVTDFGVSRGLDSSADSCNSYVGTLIFMAPERIPGGHAKTEYTNKVDIWAVGITMYQMVTGTHPYEKYQSFLDYFHVVGRSPSLDPKYDEDFREFVDMALQQEPQKRPDCATLLSATLMKYAEELSQSPDFRAEYLDWLGNQGRDSSEHDKLMAEIDDWM
eukprot:TRINITY_DN1997_c0_g1_i1.p1 TRINITY_DN1997_c0_g1~~TRINITY_DN1997_c0_g1_i1.p1  ORF type:complete len:346 (+),score=58.17 TRINITY_DN1997_c0_g1_i1:72-1109(+)